MPELPDIQLYVRALQQRVSGRVLRAVRVASPFVLRTVEPNIDDVRERSVVSVERLGKRIVIGLERDLFLVIHLMVAGRFAWKDKPYAALPKRIGLAAFDFESGTLILREVAKKKRAALHLIAGRAALEDLDAGGLEVLSARYAAFKRAVTAENHTLKRTLTDPRILSGIGNSYSDEILHRAGLSPLRLTNRLEEAELKTLFRATKDVLQEWIERLGDETGDAFPEKVTAFRPEMAVHGRYRKPCPECESPVQRIRYADNECNYCAKCQNAGKLLADRALSRLLKRDWPKTLEELEQFRPS